VLSTALCLAAAIATTDGKGEPDYTNDKAGEGQVTPEPVPEQPARSTLDPTRLLPGLPPWGASPSHECVSFTGGWAWSGTAVSRSRPSLLGRERAGRSPVGEFWSEL
jgi:hypothetical protein